jgi:hypothetical protein
LRPDGGSFLINENADPLLCTHIIYTLAGLDINVNIVSPDLDNDVRDSMYE